MAKLNLGTLTASERLALAAQLDEYRKKDEELEKLVASFRTHVEGLGFTPAAAAEVLDPKGRLGRAANDMGARNASTAKPPSSDRPVAGVTYVHPETGVEWTRPQSGRGAPNRALASLVAAGTHTWANLATKPGTSPVRGAIVRGPKKAAAENKPAK